MNVIESFRRGALVAMLVVLAAACAPASPHEPNPGSEEVLAQADPGATTFASVRANGTGCPPGTSSTAISRDGAVFTTTFSNYVAQVDASTDVSVRDCQLEIALHTPEGRSYSVQSFSYSGFAALQPGVIGRQTANYYFQGNPVLPVESNRTELVGPHEKDYVFKDDVRLEDRVWSPCGVERNLNVVTRVQLFNTSPRRGGYMNLTAVDGSSKLELVLASRPCQADTVAPPVAALAKVGAVTVTPSSIERDQPFAVRWTAPAQNAEATYTVQLRTSEQLGDALVWESASTRNSSVVYDGAVLEVTGTYRLVVIARRGEEEARSDAISLVVREIADTQPQLGKPSAVRVSPSPIARDQPFMVTWTPSSNASSSATYRVEVHTPQSAGFQLVASAPETPASVAALPANVLPRDGSYQVVVIARDAGRETSSEPLTVAAVATTPASPPPTDPSDKPPIAPPAATASKRLVGQYATRMMGYSRNDRDSVMGTKELGLAEISDGPRGLELRYSLCSQDTRALGFTLTLSRPEAYPATVRRIIVDGERWYTEGPAVGTGYDRDGIAACRGRAGQYIARQPSQRWLSGGTCRCPTSSTAIPTLEDCRVTDPDGDGRPALAYKWYGPGGTFDYTSHVATLQRSQLRNGIIAEDGRHVTGLKFDEATFAISCEGLLCRVGENAAINSTYLPCKSSYNRFEFSPLPDPPPGEPRWTCVTLRSAEARLFPRPVIGNPGHCDTEKLTDTQQP